MTKIRSTWGSPSKILITVSENRVSGVIPRTNKSDEIEINSNIIKTKKLNKLAIRD